MIALRLAPGSAAAASRYRVVGQTLLADRPLEWLEPFAAAGPAVALPGDAAGDAAGDAPSDAGGAGELLFGGRAFLARRQRELSCRRLAGGFLIEAEELGSFFYRENGARLEVLAAVPGAPTELLAEALLGPLLALALAQRGIFLLHAGGCAIDGAAFLFLGESGAGKSTLAARLGHPRLADDQAAIDAASLGLLADFPQPKLPAADQRALALAPPRPLGGLLLVEKAPAETEPRLEPLPAMVAAAGVLRHTTAARCFDPPLLRTHLDFAASLASQIPVFRLIYPHHPGAPEKIGALLARG